MKSWQIYDTARKVLKTKIFEIYGNRNSRMIHYWAQDPDYSSDYKRNPIDRLELLINYLVEAGKRDVALSVLRILAGRVDCTIEERKEVIPDKETLLGEIVDDMPCLVAYQKALEGDDLEEVDRAEAELQRELAENRVKYIETLSLKRSR
ncbi:MAG: hypothetical protein GY847_01275 [Proteobacteria bacterium]|nr:hypothetical protein [Pseudomonadota bacterium]